jgi:transposase-like protein
MAKRYSQQFKAGAVEQVHKKAAHQSIPTIAAALGIGESTLNKWLSDDRANNGTQIADEHKRIRELEADNKHLKEVVEILKKASAYFAAHQK